MRKGLIFSGKEFPLISNSFKFYSKEYTSSEDVLVLISNYNNYDMYSRLDFERLYIDNLILTYSCAAGCSAMGFISKINE